jgi:enoyl-CoA hydratase
LFEERAKAFQQASTSVPWAVLSDPPAWTPGSSYAFSFSRARPALRRSNLRKPVIVAIHGFCIGGGVDLSCACDIRLASRDAIFSIRETRMAMVADLGTLQRMPSIVGESWFRELALTGRDFSAEEALKMNFITRLCEDQSSLYREAGKLAVEIAACSPLAVQGVNDVMRFDRENGVRAGLEYVAQKNAAILISEDLMEADNAYMEKRRPQIKGKWDGFPDVATIAFDPSTWLQFQMR